ncbi:integral membrane protein TerC family protein [Asticcacaulis biprosthecium C19]|uniref:Integral membrane protein TerC family protein n=1 Tax=Asticcacaulis biprosthecium C19 TaxID=715226 RepID=F4QMG3_9CAUL|nr:TerC family protein [Asticcacaulis biprosthecium]EGF91404.1 integral membrane protein TerC family protein [Asticcacaulis biprosthecium C19]
MEFLFEPIMGKPLWMWASFLAIVVTLLAFDLGVLHRKTHEISIRESLWMSAFYIAMAMAFGGWVWWSLGDQAGKEYLTGFIVEKTLAMDNVFLISLIFTYFAIPPLYQHRVLFWGILGVIVLRGIMIALGATLVAQYGWILYIFAVFLIFTGVKMLFMGDKHPDIASNPLLKLMRKVFPISDKLDGQKFLTRQADPVTGKWRLYATPLLVALLLIEFVDLIFAVDSVPAIFTITLDPFIVFTSNIFAILGLRALYFALAAIIHRFKYLKPALAFVLIFIGAKVFIADALGLEKFPANISLAVTLGLIAIGVIVSLVKTSKTTPEPDHGPD